LGDGDRLACWQFRIELGETYDTRSRY
jgi:hypothetical protein